MFKFADVNRRQFLQGVAGVAASGAVAFGLRVADPSHFQTSEAFAYESKPALDDEGRLPDLDGATSWLNSVPLSNRSLRGKVVVVNFWTYSCINSLRPLPYLKDWAAKHKDAGLVVVGIHTPEFPFEETPSNVAIALHEHGLLYPVALDSRYKIWQAFNNEYWPAFYFIDGKGNIRHHQFGEGGYEESEHVIQELLTKNGATGLDGSLAKVSGIGVEAAPSRDQQSPETYIGYRQAERFASPERLAHDSQKTYSLQSGPSLNQWGLRGSWTDGSRSAVLQEAPGAIVFRFHSRDLHVVLGPAQGARPVRFTLKLDGVAPDVDCGTDSSPAGEGEISEYRLYQLIRQKGHIKDRTFEIEFLDPGVQAFSFTFG